MCDGGMVVGCEEMVARRRCSSLRTNLTLLSLGQGRCDGRFYGGGILEKRDGIVARRSAIIARHRGCEMCAG